MIEHRAFFGDGEKLFAFPTRELIEELERKTGHGIGALFRRFRTSDYSLSDVLQVIRLGLIGGGIAPVEADRLVNVYGIARPLTESFEVADGIIAALFFGNEEAADPDMTMDETVFWTNDELEDEAQGEIGQAAASGDLAASINEALKQVAA